MLTRPNEWLILKPDLLEDYNQATDTELQEFFSEGNIVPLTIVYEDFVQEYEKTVRKILGFLELNAAALEISHPQLVPTADDLSEQWAQRFRTERQKDWKNRGW